MVFSLFASVSFVTVIAGLLSGACPETEYEFDIAELLYGSSIPISFISFNSIASLKRRQLQPLAQDPGLQIMFK